MREHEPPEFETLEDFNCWLLEPIPAGMSRPQADEILRLVCEQITGETIPDGTLKIDGIRHARAVLATKHGSP